MERLETAICELAGCWAGKIVDNVMARVAEFADGAPQSDDITCVALYQVSLIKTHVPNRAIRWT